jgi:4-hydroxy-tetrahydrodipicolinate synthase
MPMVLFHSPSRSGVRLDVDFTLELINAIPRFAAIKDASGDLTFLAELQKSAPSEFRVLQGLDELLLPSFALGSPGAVISLGNLFPRMLRRMEQAYVSGDLDTAREIQFNLLPACRAIYGEPNPGPLKRALAMAGRSAGPTREPIYEPSGATVQALEELMSALCKAEASVYDG